MTARILNTPERIWISTKYLQSKSPNTICAEWPFPSVPPSLRQVYRILMKFQETGTVLTRKGKTRKPQGRSPLSLANGTNLMDNFIQNPRSSIRTRARQLNIPKSTVLKKLKEFGLRPYHPTWVQNLKEGDSEKR